MSDYNKHLPLEVLLTVFKHLEDPTDLLQSRGFYNHLRSKPELVHLIKGVELDVDDRNLQLDILKLVFTPTLAYLGMGMWIHSRIFAIMVNLMSKYPGQKFNLIRLPACEDPESDINYAKVAYAVRETLQYLAISTHSKLTTTVLKNLKGFSSLKSLEIDASSGSSNVRKINSILKNCCYLEELEMACGNGGHTLQSQASLATWIRSNVEQVKTLKSLAVSYASPDLLEYLIFKYPQVTKVKFKKCAYQQASFMRIMNAVGNLSEYKLQFFWNQPQELEIQAAAIVAIATSFKEGTALYVKISYGVDHDYDEEDENEESDLAELRVANSAGVIRINLTLESTVSHQLYRNIVDFVGNNAQYNLTRLAVNTIEAQSQQDEDDEPNAFYRSITKLPALECVDISTKKIQYKPITLPAAVSGRKLAQIILRSSQIDARVFPQISKLFPDLQELVLSECSILDNGNGNAIEEDTAKVWTINLPHSSLSLSLSDNDESTILGNSYPIFLDSETPVPGDCYIKVSVLDLNSQMYCKLDRSGFSYITKRDFEYRFTLPDDRLFDITCKNMWQLHVDMSGCSKTIHVNYDLSNNNRVLSLKKKVDQVARSTMEIADSSGLVTLKKQLHDLEAQTDLCLASQEKTKASLVKPGKKFVW
ncbi:hypothetical protein MBANPS3_010280 [Mucor bainieri]